MSIGRRVNCERVVLFGWGAAVLLQFAHPKVAAGVSQHTAAMESPRARVRRLNRTVQAMLGLTFGDQTEAAAVAGHINAIHTRVNGVMAESLPPYTAGDHYSAEDPELLRWVFATLLLILPRTYGLVVRPLTAAERDAYCLESRAMGMLLGIPPDRLFPNAAALDAYLQTMLASDAIVVGDTARALARDLLAPNWPLLARPVLALLALPAFGLLPPAIRQAYGVPWSPWHERSLGLLIWALRHILPFMPASLRYWPTALTALRRTQPDR
jgi:uncharacterized protein (DUF2236 family)